MCRARLRAAQHAGVARLQAQRGGIHRDVRAGPRRRSATTPSGTRSLWPAGRLSSVNRGRRCRPGRAARPPRGRRRPGAAMRRAVSARRSRIAGRSAGGRLQVEPVGVDDLAGAPPRSPRRSRPARRPSAAAIERGQLRAPLAARGRRRRVLGHRHNRTRLSRCTASPAPRAPASLRSSAGGLACQPHRERRPALLDELDRVARIEPVRRPPSARPAAGWCPRSSTARRAPASTVSRPRTGLPYRSHSLNAGSGLRLGMQRVPTGSPAAAADSTAGPRRRVRSPSGCRRRWPSRPPPPWSACRRIPIRGERPPTSSSVEQAVVAHLGDHPGTRRAGAAVVQPLDVGQQHQQPGAQHQRHLGGQRVVVPERDLVGGRGVVLVHHRHAAPSQQRSPACAARSGSAVAAVDVARGQQHLSGLVDRAGERALPPPLQQRLADGRGGLQLGQPLAARAARPRLPRPSAIAPELTSTTRVPPPASAATSRATLANTRGRALPRSSTSVLEPTLTTTAPRDMQAIIRPRRGHLSPIAPVR